MLNSRINRSVPLLLLIGLLCLYIATASGHVASIDGETRFRLTQALVERGSAVIGHPGGGIAHQQSTEGRWYSSMQNDEGEWVPWVLPGASYLGVPLYALAKFFASVVQPPWPDYYYRFAFSFVNPLVTAFAGFFLFLLCRELGVKERAALIVTLLFSFGSAAWSFAKSDIDSTVVCTTTLMAFFAAERMIKVSDNKKILLAGAIGLAVGWGLITRQVAALWLPVLMLYTLIRFYETQVLSLRNTGRLLVGILMGLLPPLLLTLLYNHLRFGDPLDFGSARIVARIGSNVFNTDPEWPEWRAALALTVSPGLGFFFHAPALFLLPVSLRSAWGRFRTYTAFALGTAIVYVIGYSSYTTWDGGGFGPRFMLPVMAVLFPLLGPMIERAFEKGRTRLIGALTLALIILQLLLIPVYPPFALERLQDEGYHQRMTYFSLTRNQIVTHLRLLPELSLTPLEQTPAENVSRTWRNPVRQTPDFWWAFLYRYEVGRPWILMVPFVLFLAGGLALLRALWIAGKQRNASRTR